MVIIAKVSLRPISFFSHDELLLPLSLSTSQVSVSSLRLSSKLTVSLFLSLLSLTSSLLTLLTLLL